MLGARMKSLREENGLTQKEIADFLGVTPKAVSFYELEQRSPSWDMVVKLAEKYNVTTDYLLGKSDSRNFESNSNEQPLDDDLKKILEIYEGLTPEEKQIFKNMLNAVFAHRQ